jgi:DNA-binding transcriptional LysR family regulator
MDLYQIHYFLAIVETGSFTKAADRLFVSQPSLSGGIKKLEQELGVILLERGGRKIILTQAGELFLEKARKILHEYNSLVHDLELQKGNPTLRVGSLHTMRGVVIAKLISSFRLNFPNVVIEFCTGYKEDLTEKLEQGTVDIAITLFDENNDATEELFWQPVHLAVPKHHPLAQRERVPKKEINGLPFIERIHCEIGRNCPQYFDGLEPRIIYWADNEDWVISLIRAGLGATIMPVWMDLEGIVYLPFEDLQLERRIGLKWRTTQDSQLVDNFRLFAVNHNWEV